MRISSLQIFKKNVDLMLTKQSQVLTEQERIATGNRVSQPGEDPVAFARISLLNHRLQQTESFQRNQETANDRLSIEESTLANIELSIDRLKEIQIQAGDGALSQNDRASLAAESTELLEQLQSFANTRDSNGHYIFAGSQVLQEAVTYDNLTDTYVYNGDHYQRELDVSSSLRVAVTDDGERLFMDIRNSEGEFTATAGIDAAANITYPAYPVTVNVGTALISRSEVVNRDEYIENIDTYFITFNDNAGVMEYTVTDSNNNLVVQATPYTIDAPIAFRGIEVEMDRSPFTIADGDIHRITPIADESMFTTVQNMITNLQSSISNNTDQQAFNDASERALFQLNLIQQRILDVRTEVGSRLKNVERAGSVNEEIIFSSKSTISLLKDADIVTAVSTLNRETVALQAIQQSYASIQNLSLFNYF